MDVATIYNGIIDFWLVMGVLALIGIFYFMRGLR